jgi:glutaredoxin
MKKEIILLTKQGCKPCNDLKFSLFKRGISFEEINAGNPHNLKRLKKMRVLPVLRSLPTTLLLIDSKITTSIPGNGDTVIKRIQRFWEGEKNEGKIQV